MPKGVLLPFGPVQETFYVPQTGDISIDFVLLRGEGHPEDCFTIAPRSVDFFEPATAGDELNVSWFIEPTGELTFVAHDHKDRELVVMKASSIAKDNN